jgi:hypothetical protein
MSITIQVVEFSSVECLCAQFNCLNDGLHSVFGAQFIKLLPQNKKTINSSVLRLPNARDLSNFLFSTFAAPPSNWTVMCVRCVAEGNVPAGNLCH